MTNDGKIIKTDVAKVRSVWDEFAQKYGMDRRASTPDAYLVDLEIRTLTRQIKNGDRVLDIGTGNGYTALKLAMKKNIYITGIDISQEMVSNASKMREKYSSHIKGNAQFEIGNILDTEFLNRFQSDSYDVILTKRSLINILSWKEQKESISKFYKLLKPAGKYIMIEATVQGYENINRLRERFGISKTRIRWHNNYLDEEKLIPFLNSTFQSVYFKDFSSTYYVGSRVIQPLLLKPFGKEPSYDFRLNWFFSHLPSSGNYGIQKLIVCHKKEL